MPARKNAGFKELTAEDLMTTPVLSLDAGDGLKEAARFLLSHGYSGAPVIDDAGKPIGVLTMHDIARYAEWHLEAEESAESRKETVKAEDDEDDEMDIDRLTGVTVRQIMTPQVQKVAKGDSVNAVIKTLLRGPYHRLFVADKQGILVGVISTMDVMRALSKAM